MNDNSKNEDINNETTIKQKDIQIELNNLNEHNNYLRGQFQRA